MDFIGFETKRLLDASRNIMGPSTPDDGETYLRTIRSENKTCHMLRALRSLPSDQTYDPYLKCSSVFIQYAPLWTHRTPCNAVSVRPLQ